MKRRTYSRTRLIQVISINTDEQKKKAKLSANMLCFLLDRTLFNRILSRKNTAKHYKHKMQKKFAGIN